MNFFSFENLKFLVIFLTLIVY